MLGAECRSWVCAGSTLEKVTQREAGTGYDFAVHYARTELARERALRMHRLVLGQCVRSHRRRKSHTNWAGWQRRKNRYRRVDGDDGLP